MEFPGHMNVAGDFCCRRGPYIARPELREVRDAMGLDRDSTVLLFSTEGDTDPKGYQQIVKNGMFPLPS